MNDCSYPTAETLRDALIQRVERFTALSGGSRTSVGEQAVGNGKFVHDVARGENFTVETYGRVMAWLDTNWPEQQEPSDAE